MNNDNTHPPSVGDFDPLAAIEEFQPVQQTATLERVSALAAQMVSLEIQMAEKAVELAELQSAFEKISQRTIPDIMSELAMESFTLADGSKVEVKPDVKASITEENRPAAHKWLREHNYDGIIKTKVGLAFGKGEADKAEAARVLLENAGYSATVDEGVHAATLKSFVKERLEAGEKVPQKEFGIYEFKKTKITAPKKSSAKSSKIKPEAAPEVIQAKPQVSENF